MPDPIVIDFDDTALQEALSNEENTRSGTHSVLSPQLAYQIGCLLFLLQQGRDVGFSYGHWLTYKMADGGELSLKQSLIKRGNDAKGRARFLILDKQLATGCFGMGFKSTKGLTLDADNCIRLKQRQPDKLRFFKLVLSKAFNEIKPASQEALTRESAIWKALEGGSKRIKSPYAVTFSSGKGLVGKKDRLPQQGLGMLGIYYEGVEIELDFLKRLAGRGDWCYPQDKIARLEIIASFLQALIAMHAQGFVHGDLKVGNLILNPTIRQVKIIDYDQSYPEGVELHRAIGTPEYASLAALNPPVTVRKSIDIYSAAIVMFELWHGGLLLDARKGKLTHLAWRNTYNAAVKQKLLEDPDNPLHKIILEAMADDTQLSAQALLNVVIQEQERVALEGSMQEMKL